MNEWMNECFIASNLFMSKEEGCGEGPAEAF